MPESKARETTGPARAIDRMVGDPVSRAGSWR